MDTILSVRELTERLRHVLEQRFPYIWVRGEVTNLSRPSSGHVYFSLKDGDALLGCVWFRGQQRAQENFDPLTGEVWEDGPRPSPALGLENGQELVCAGRLSVYGPRGSYQLIVDLAQETGLGQWHLAFEALKQKLAGLGFFEQARKRPIPETPRRVALITAATGAAIQDFIRVASDRGLGANIRLYPTPVQGDEAPGRIVAALAEANADGWAQVAVMIRGGGSIQDLWAFNDERVARAVFESRLPVLTGVGHEIDHSIADFVADRSAATPSHAAQLLWSERRIHVQQVDDLETALREVMERRLQAMRNRLEHIGRTLTLLSPAERLKRQAERLHDAAARLRPAAINAVVSRQNNLQTAFSDLIRFGGSGSLERRENRLAGLTLRLTQTGEDRLDRAARETERWTERLQPLGQAGLLRQRHYLENMEARLSGLDPHAPLERGYALLRDSNGRFMQSIHQVKPGDALSAEVRDGVVHTHVDSVAPK